MEIAQLLHILHIDKINNFCKFCTVVALLFLITTYLTPVYAADVHRLRWLLAELFLIGGILWFIDDLRYNYWKHANLNEYSQHAELSPGELEEKYLEGSAIRCGIFILIGFVLVLIYLH